MSKYPSPLELVTTEPLVQNRDRDGARRFVRYMSHTEVRFLVSRAQSNINRDGDAPRDQEMLDEISKTIGWFA